MTDIDITEALAEWDCEVRTATPFYRGWNSSTWRVSTWNGVDYVAKLVDLEDAEGFANGMRVARYVADRGFVSGAPVPTRSGDLLVEHSDGVLALLELVPGEPPDLSLPEHLRRMGRLLARAHQLMVDCPIGAGPANSWPWPWVDWHLEHTPMAAPVRVAARQAWSDVVNTTERAGLTISLLHSDPSPSGFLLADDPDHDALIDWTTALRGPLLYDIGSIQVTSGADDASIRHFLDGYLMMHPPVSPELSFLNMVTRARWVANVIYFADRISRGIIRGLSDATTNESELARAYSALQAAR